VALVDVVQQTFYFLMA